MREQFDSPLTTVGEKSCCVSYCIKDRQGASAHKHRPREYTFISRVQYTQIYFIFFLSYLVSFCSVLCVL